MKRLYLIGGPMGVGKTTVCQELKRLTAPSVFLDGDWCWDMEPFQVTAETLQARTGKDVAAGLRTWDVLERSLQRLPLYQDLPTEKLWVDDLTPQQAAQRLAGDRA